MSNLTDFIAGMFTSTASAKARKATEAGKAGQSAQPISDKRRLDNYLGQTGLKHLTDRQFRQYRRMARRRAAYRLRREAAE